MANADPNDKPDPISELLAFGVELDPQLRVTRSLVTALADALDNEMWTASTVAFQLVLAVHNLERRMIAEHDDDAAVIDIRDQLHPEMAISALMLTQLVDTNSSGLGAVSSAVVRLESLMRFGDDTTGLTDSGR